MVLRMKDGKCVTVRRSKGTVKLLVSDQQGDGSEVKIQRHENQMSIHCYKAGVCYIPKVEKNGLKLVRLNKSGSQSLSAEYLFERVDVGLTNYYGLRSVKSPRCYVSVSGTELSVSEDDTRCAHITNE